MRRSSFCIASAAVAACSLIGVARATTVTVSPTNMNGWAFDPRETGGGPGTAADGVGAMVVGPLTPPAGVGSANLLAVNGAGAIRLERTYAGTPLSSITSMSYNTYVANNSGTVQAPY